jgi:hypothetical protein
MNHLSEGQDLTLLSHAGRFTETAYAEVAFGLGFSVMLDPTRVQILGTPGEYAWDGVPSGVHTRGKSQPWQWPSSFPQ